MENNIGKNSNLALKLLREADEKWGEISKSEIFLYDRLNNGEWIRPWLNAITQASR
ncbi:hypothetical protein [Burkholderia oklahomensis]|uniref:hypothetical protein n=1 Tax=Burkholderia oklahomensis TaxID=342113 RepID=UPI000AE4B3CE|nr:hypothetical protein [Burkholderia oklahomensis]